MNISGGEMFGCHKIISDTSWQAFTIYFVISLVNCYSTFDTVQLQQPFYYPSNPAKIASSLFFLANTHIHAHTHRDKNPCKTTNNKPNLCIFVMILCTFVFIFLLLSPFSVVFSEVTEMCVLCAQLVSHKHVYAHT